MIIYHIASKEDWDTAFEAGQYYHPSLKEEGFIHCSLENQVSGVLERYFQGKTNLVKLVIDTDKLTERLVFDWSPSTADHFPHLYGPLNTDAVIDTVYL